MKAEAAAVRTVNFLLVHEGWSCYLGKVRSNSTSVFSNKKNSTSEYLHFWVWKQVGVNYRSGIDRLIGNFHMSRRHLTSAASNKASADRAHPWPDNIKAWDTGTWLVLCPPDELASVPCLCLCIYPAPTFQRPSLPPALGLVSRARKCRRKCLSGSGIKLGHAAFSALKVERPPGHAQEKGRHDGLPDSFMQLLSKEKGEWVARKAILATKRKG